MHSPFRTPLVLALALLLGLCGTARGAGLLSPADGSLPPLQIKSQAVKVVIEDGYAVTTVEQVFSNPNDRDLEAVYSFPVPEHGAVSEFTVWIDGKPVVGEVFAKEEARRIYQEEKDAGRDAGLTEKDGYRTFDIRVSPVRAGQDTRLRLVYLQPAQVDHAVGRYVYPLEEGGVDEQRNAFWSVNEQVQERFTFDLAVRSALPVDAVLVPGRGSAVVQQDPSGDWTVRLDAAGAPVAAAGTLAMGRTREGTSETFGGPVLGAVAGLGVSAAGVVASLAAGIPPDPMLSAILIDSLAALPNAFSPAPAYASNLPPGAVEAALGTGPAIPEAGAASPAGAGPAQVLDSDLVVYWRLAPGQPGSVDLVAHKPAGAASGTFMLVLTPGDDLKPITEGRDWVFVLDMSGSMHGKYATLADGVGRSLARLRQGDRFRIVLFNDSAQELTDGFVPVTPDAVATYSAKVANIQPGQGTNLYDGLKLGLHGLDNDRTGALVLVTDGVANVGETAQRKFLELLRSRDVRLFTFIMGNSANRPLLEAMATASGGFAQSVSNSDDITGQLMLAVSKVGHQALHGVTLDISGVKTADLAPRAFGSLYRGQQLVAFGRYFGHGPATVRLSGRISGEEMTYQTTFDFPAAAERNPEIERLMAYAAIEDIMREVHDFGEKPDLRQAVVDLGVAHGLVTDYTSMLVLSEEQFTARQVKRANRDRVAMEETARQARASQPAQSNRADAAAPMFTGSRATTGSGAGSGSGGGAFDPWMLLILVPLVLYVLLRRRNER